MADDQPIDGSTENPYPDDLYPPDPDDYDLEPAMAGGVPTPRGAAVRQQAKRRSQNPNKTANTISIPRSGKKILAREKQRKALELRKAGASYNQIADAVGYSDASGARKAVIKAFREVIQEPAKETRSLQIERLNHMLMTLWPKVQQGDERAIDTSLRVMDKIDRLMGTEAPTQTEVNVTHKDAILVVDGNSDEYIRALQQMAAVRADGSNANAKAIEAAGVTATRSVPPGMEHTLADVIDVEVIEDGDDPQPDPQAVEEPHVVPVEAAPPQKTRKTYRFGVDPTVTRKDS